jgi:Rieske 2Fe-2S family protein
LIFVCPAPDAPPSIADAIESCVPDLAQIEPERLKPAAVRRYEVAANWKLLLEHHPYCASRAGAHPELEHVLDLRAVRDRSTDATGARFVAEAPRLRDGMRSASRDGRAVSRPLGRFADGADPRGWSTGLRAQPVPLQIVAYADHLLVHTVSAVRVDRSLWTTHWLVHEDAEEGRDYSRDELMHVWDETIKQHVCLVEEARHDEAAADLASDMQGLADEPLVRSALKAYVLALEAAS